VRSLNRDLRGRRCVIDGEIVCLDPEGKAQFRDLLFHRAEPFFYAFDLLWDEHTWPDNEVEMRRFRNGEDTRYLPLVDRKQRLRQIVPKAGERLLYCDHVEASGEQLFRLARQQDLEGIVAKRKADSYLPDHAEWVKIRNQSYSQWIGREELFERERKQEPSFSTGLDALWRVVVSPIAAYIFNFITLQHSLVYWAELFGIYAFGLYWCVKTKEMSGPDIQRMLAERHDEVAV
jgi:hypothetical protein